MSSIKVNFLLLEIWNNILEICFFYLFKLCRWDFFRAILPLILTENFILILLLYILHYPIVFFKLAQLITFPLVQYNSDFIILVLSKKFVLILLKLILIIFDRFRTIVSAHRWKHILLNVFKLQSRLHIFCFQILRLTKLKLSASFRINQNGVCIILLVLNLNSEIDVLIYAIIADVLVIFIILVFVLILIKMEVRVLGGAYLAALTKFEAVQTFAFLNLFFA